MSRSFLAAFFFVLAPAFLVLSSSPKTLQQVEDRAQGRVDKREKKKESKRVLCAQKLVVLTSCCCFSSFALCF